MTTSVHDHTIEFRSHLSGIDWVVLKNVLASDHFDNGRSPDQLQRSFVNSQIVCIAWSGGQVIATGRVLSDGVGNAYMIDVWTHVPCRRLGVATQEVHKLCAGLSGQCR
jgi:hypothetical protein